MSKPRLRFSADGQRASPENPSTSLSNPDAWLYETLGASAASSGVSVNEQSALRFTTVYAAISLLAETVAQLPLSLYRKRGNKRELVKDHPAARAVRNPHPTMSSYIWRETMQGHAGSWGNGYSYIRRDGAGRPMGLKLLLADRTRADLVRDEVMFTTRINNREVPLLAEDVLHVPAFGLDGVMGMSPIRTHREAIGGAMAAQQFGSQFFGKGASLGGVLTLEKGLGDEAIARLKKQWDALKGQGYTGTAILEEGMDYKAIGIPPEDAQFIETRKFSRSDIASIYKIPPHMIGDLDKATFSNIAEQSIQFLRFTMMPWLIKWEEELNRKLLTEKEQEDYYFKFTVQALQRGTQKERYESYNHGITGGFLSRNEVREWEELDPIEGLDEPLQPLNMAAAGEEPAAEPEPEPTEDERARAVRLVQPFVATFCERVASMSSGAMVRLIKRDLGRFGESAAEWLQDTKTAETILRNIEPLAAALNDDQLAAEFLGEFRTGWQLLIEETADPLSIQPIPAADYVEWFDHRYGVTDCED